MSDTEKNWNVVVGLFLQISYFNTYVNSTFTELVDFCNISIFPNINSILTIILRSSINMIYFNLRFYHSTFDKVYFNLF